MEDVFNYGPLLEPPEAIFQYLWSTRMSLAARIPLDLLTELDQRFPDQCPSINDSDRQVWINKGKREAVEFLKRVYGEQNENILKE